MCLCECVCGVHMCALAVCAVRVFDIVMYVRTRRFSLLV